MGTGFGTLPHLHNRTAHMRMFISAIPVKPALPIRPVLHRLVVPIWFGTYWVARVSRPTVEPLLQTFDAAGRQQSTIDLRQQSVVKERNKRTR